MLDKSTNEAQMLRSDSINVKGIEPRQTRTHATFNGKHHHRPESDRCRRSVHLYALLDVLDLVHELHLCHPPDVLELHGRPDHT